VSYYTDLTDEERNRRQHSAMKRLRAAGIYRAAQVWIHDNRPPIEFEGTALEYAELEMSLWYAWWFNFRHPITGRE